MADQASAAPAKTGPFVATSVDRVRRRYLTAILSMCLSVLILSQRYLRYHKITRDVVQEGQNPASSSS